MIEYTGERISVKEAWFRRERMKSPGKLPPIYFFYLDRARRVDGSVGGSGAELINHSCSPNLRARLKRGRFFFYSLRTIGAGEELTLDYRLPRDADRYECRCGSPGCRGTINRK